MKHKVDIETFGRKHSVAFFKEFVSPVVALTSEVECTGAKQRAEAHGISFFCYYAHAMLKAMNEVKEMKYRQDKAGDIYYYDTLDMLAIITTGENGAYATLFVPYQEDLKAFAVEVQSRIEAISVQENPFSSELEMIGKDNQGVFLISALPTFSFTGISFAERGGMTAYPLSLIGKQITREEKEYLPIAITANHAFVDGFHINLFYEKVAANLRT